ncbi:aminopeptidase [Candidatus Dojkabacteria bacterium]|nr:aminopeptidase [Candidatus Dojkabacteria bacterium]
MATYEPEQKILSKYADVLIKFALNSGDGVKKDEVVVLVVPDIAKPLLKELQRAVLESEAHPVVRMYPTGMDRQFYELASDEQLKFFPKKYKKAFVDLIDHQVGIIGDVNLKELDGIDPHRIVLSQEARKKTREWLEDKEYKGNFTWTLGLYGTSAYAKEAGMSLEGYWGEIIRACYLDKKDPVGEWKKILKAQERVKAKLDKLNIESLKIEGEDIDLTVKLGEKRRWLGGSGRNIPSYELFISPDWRGTEGYIKFNQPLFMYGNKIEDIELWFEKGKVVKADASKNLKLLEKMIERKNADKVGEFSLTDKKFSRIHKFMANTLYDENVGGGYGNMHIALGLAYKESYTGDIKSMKKSDWKKAGFNQSPEHKDIINTQRKTVTATLKSGKKIMIYRDGEFLV